MEVEMVVFVEVVETVDVDSILGEGQADLEVSTGIS